MTNNPLNNNRIPNKIPIMRMEDYHTHYLGKTEDGRQFWGYETFVFTKPIEDINANDWQNHRKEYVLLHTFDMQGNYLETKYWFGGITTNADQEQMIGKLEEWISELGRIEYSNIEVKLFQITIDGIIFGLIPNIDGRSIELQPSSTISFQEPWDGEYFT